MSRPVALVTGGARGIGFGCASRLAAEGYDLAIVGSREESAAAESLAALRASGVAVLYVRADIAEDSAAEFIIEAVRKRFGRLDAVVNNAGVAPRERRDVLEATRESFDRLLSINLRGPYFLTQAAARWMIAEREAEPSAPMSVVFITSMSAAVASINRGEYCISKSGLSMAAQLWAVRLAPHAIPVYEVRPGVIRTDMTAKVTALYDKLIGEGLTLEGRWGTPEDVGRAVAALVRGDLPYATGSVIPVDGGLTVRRL